MIYAGRINVGTTQTLLDPAVTNPESSGSTAVKNLGTVSVYLGGDGVTTSTGWELAAGDAISIDFAAYSDLYAVAASGTQPVQVLRSGS